MQLEENVERLLRELEEKGLNRGFVLQRLLDECKDDVSEDLRKLSRIDYNFGMLMDYLGDEFKEKAFELGDDDAIRDAACTEAIGRIHFQVPDDIIFHLLAIKKRAEDPKFFKKYFKEPEPRTALGIKLDFMAN